MDLLWSRETMIALAILGGTASLIQMLLKALGHSNPTLDKRLNVAAYTLMTASMTVLVVAGFRSPV
jgi:hypothetical protein